MSENPVQPTVLFAVRGVSKRFGAVTALGGVDLTVRAGEVHALIGENGAGKSTLMKILAGVYQPDSGRIELDAAPYEVGSPAEARRRGVAMIYQELTLAPHLSVEENITLGLEHSRFGFTRSRELQVREALGRLGHGTLDTRQPVAALSIGVRQVVEIARALIGNARLIIMDEPTSSLSADDTQALFQVIRLLKTAGVTIIYISHFLEEVQQIADRYTVLRDGMTAATGAIAEVTQQELIRSMVGRSLSEMFPRVPHTMGEPVLAVHEIGGKVLPKKVSFELHKGEIMGIAGLVGAGRSETVRALFGLESGRHGSVRLRSGRQISLSGMTPPLALRNQLDLLSEDRKGEGLALRLSIDENVALSSLRRFASFGFVKSRQRRQAGENRCRQLNVRYDRIGQPADSLSGGNQQKVALARLLCHDSDILFLDEPTRGVDVGSKAEICRLIGQLAAAGKAVVVISSYLPELFGVCDTLAVMHRGSLSPVRPVNQWTESEIMHFATAGEEHH